MRCSLDEWKNCKVISSIFSEIKLDKICKPKRKHFADNLALKNNNEKSNEKNYNW